MSDLDLRVYLVTSGTGQRTVDVAAEAAAAGAGVVQVRAKSLDARALLALLSAVAERVAQANPAARVVVDDRTDVAYAARLAGAPVHGVHLGQEDLSPRVAREMLGPDAFIGFTTGTLRLVEEANKFADVLSYVGAGPYRPTPTKNADRPPLGVEGYPPLVEASRVPVVAIGDVQTADVAELSETGIAGVAMVRQIMNAEDPGAVVRESLRAWRG